MSTVEKTVLYEMEVMVLLCDCDCDCDWVGMGVVKKRDCDELYLADSVELLGNNDNDATMTLDIELLFSKVIVDSIVSAGSEILIGGLDEATGTEDEGGGGDTDDSPDDELL